jgi:hypothetical protein
VIGVIGAVFAAAVVSGCGGGGTPPVNDELTSTPPAPTALSDAAAQLAGLAAAAKDRRMTAFYTLRGGDRPDRTIAVTLAADATWRVDIPGGAHGGMLDVAVVSVPAGLFQCALSGAEGAEGASGCVKVADRDGTLPAAIDPWLWRVFIEWRDVFTDRRAPLSVAAAKPPAGATGACYSVELTSASLADPVDPGIYCYAPDGTLTAAVSDFGTLVLAATPGAAPPSVPLPAPVVPGPGWQTATPPSPTATDGQP